MSLPTTGYITLERSQLAMERVKLRLAKSATALQQNGIDYCVIGGNAVAAWVESIDISAARNTVDVDLLIRREDFERVKQVLIAAGFYYHQVLDVEYFMDDENGKTRDAVHILWANEKVRATYETANPDPDDSVELGDRRIIALDKLVQMKLNSFRIKDQTHLLDLRDVGLIDQTWPAKYPPVLAARLQQILDNTDG